MGRFGLISPYKPLLSLLTRPTLFPLPDKPSFLKIRGMRDSKIPITVALPRKLWVRLDIYTRNHGVTKAHILRKAIQEEIEELERLILREK